MAYSSKEWEVVRAFYERGLSLSEIVARDEVKIKERGSISRKANQEGWIKGEKATLLQKEIDAKQYISAISEQKETFNATEAIIHEKLVDERVKQMEWLNKAALKNVSEAMKAECANQNDFRARADTIVKAKETVFGKGVETAIQINNGNDANDRPRTLAEFYRQ